MISNSIICVTPWSRILYEKLTVEHVCEDSPSFIDPECLLSNPSSGVVAVSFKVAKNYYFI
jgi:hypothetical protein